MTLRELLKKHGWFFVPRAEIRSCPCPKCGKKGLAYADHRHAFGHKDKSRIICRFCRAVFSQKRNTGSA